jgi:hypothetical protein
MDKLIELLDWLREQAGASARTVVFERMLNVGADLVSEDGENPEYDRAIYELIRDVNYDDFPEHLDDDARRDYVMHLIAVIRVERKAQS